jgi:hypothetical protein
MARQTETFELLRVLCRYDVEFVVVGMTAAVLQGAPAITFDLDVVYSRQPANVRRMLTALEDLKACFRDDPRQLVPNASHLESRGHKLLTTRLGDFDVLGTVGEDLGYEELVEDAVDLDLDGLCVKVLGLQKLIEVKRHANRPKDVAVLPLLESTLERASRKQ